MFSKVDSTGKFLVWVNFRWESLKQVKPELSFQLTQVCRISALKQTRGRGGSLETLSPPVIAVTTRSTSPHLPSQVICQPTCLIATFTVDRVYTWHWAWVIPSEDMVFINTLWWQDGRQGNEDLMPKREGWFHFEPMGVKARIWSWNVNTVLHLRSSPWDAWRLRVNRLLLSSHSLAMFLHLSMYLSFSQNSFR
jgi:hypothetical protein